MDNIIDLRRRGLRLWQGPGLGFTADSLALADYVGSRPECRKIGDLGSGNGGLTLLLWALNPTAEVIGLEIRPELVELARRSLALNENVEGLARCRFVQGDWRELDNKYNEGWEPESFDLLVSNPPYLPLGAGRVSPDPLRAAACCELNGTLPELLAAARRLLKTGRGLVLILPRSREQEVAALAGWRLERREPAAGLAERVLLELIKI